MCLLRLIS
ncbi:Protein of unknown function [Lactobacillus helveticus CIRM-BIA 953]|uniref:Uncharacterized protein n=1 Tax=Lactobacillus helveticus CIRM-BIA 953 TaxID=1226335 RepID=U4QG49_LACHE|nr:Protein of unknown function [Lactobacillus helveticus CIRM-BIA 953]